MYSGPRNDLGSALPGDASGEVILTSEKPFVVLLSKVLSEGIEMGLEESDIRPLEEGREGMLVRDIADETQHDFDTYKEAIEFAKAQNDPDGPPIDVSVLQFKDGCWTRVARIQT